MLLLPGLANGMLCCTVSGCWHPHLLLSLCQQLLGTLLQLLASLLHGLQHACLVDAGLQQRLALTGQVIDFLQARDDGNLNCV